MVMDALKIISQSWPIAAMVIALGGFFAVRSVVMRRMADAREERLDRASGNQAVVVRHNSEEG